MTQAFNLSQFANNLNTSGQASNSGLQNSSVTVTAGTGMSGGGSVALGSSVTLTNAGVTSVTAGTGISVSASTGAVTISNTSAYGGVTGQTFTGNGTFTIPTGISKLKVTLVGGGGNGGNNNGNSGGGGGVAVIYLTGLTAGNTIAVTVGAAAGLSRIASGTQAIATVTANGGANGNPNYPPTGGAGGTATNGTYNLNGLSGSFSGGGIPALGFGFGGGAGGCCTNGGPGQNYGAGGGHGGSSASGGAGTQGIVIFEW